MPRWRRLGRLAPDARTRRGGGGAAGAQRRAALDRRTDGPGHRSGRRRRGRAAGARPAAERRAVPLRASDPPFGGRVGDLTRAPRRHAPRGRTAARERRDAGRQRRGAPHADAAARGAVDRRRAAASGGAGERPRRPRRRRGVPAARAGRAPGGTRAPRVAGGHRQGREPDRLAAGAGPSARGARARRAPRRGRGGGPVAGAGAASLRARWTRPIDDAQRHRRSRPTGAAATRCSSWRPICCRSPAWRGRCPLPPRRAASLEARTPTGSPVAAAVQATLAFREMFSGAPRVRVRERVQRALLDIQRGAASSSHLADRQAPGMTLVWIDELDRAIELFTELLTGAARMGRMQTFEIFSALRAYALQRRGDLADAAADIEPILRRRADTPRASASPSSSALIVHVRLLIGSGSGRRRGSAGARRAAFRRASSAGS